MNRNLATKSDLANIITSGGGTFSSSSNEILTSSYANSLSSDSIGGTLTLTYSVESTGRSSYLSNECVLYEDIHFTKTSGPVIEPKYVVRISPWDFTITPDEWVYFTVESYYQDAEGNQTIEPGEFDMSGIDNSWFTLERDESADTGLYYGYKVKATGEVSETKTHDLYFRQTATGGDSDYIRITQRKPNAVTYTITYKASTGVSGSNVTETVEENTTYTPTVPSSFTLQSGYEEPMVCNPSEAFTVTGDKEILVTATKTVEKGTYKFIICSGSVDADPDDGSFHDFGVELGTDIQVAVSNKTSDGYVYMHIKSTYATSEGTTYPDYTVVNESEIPSWLDLDFSTICDLGYSESIIFKAKENNTGSERSFTLKLKQNDSGNLCIIQFTQADGSATFIPNFNYMIFTYTWSESDGEDLDSATRLGYGKYSLNILSNPDESCTMTAWVGYNLTGNNNPSVTLYLTYGGDNMHSGDEGCAIRFKDYYESVKSNNPEIIVAEVKTNWFGSKGETYRSYINYEAFLGGTITQNGFAFSCDGESVLNSSMLTHTHAVGKHNYKYPDKWYTRSMLVIYNCSTKSASVYFGLNAASKDLVGFCSLPTATGKNITQDKELDVRSTIVNNIDSYISVYQQWYNSSTSLLVYPEIGDTVEVDVTHTYTYSVPGMAEEQTIVYNTFNSATLEDSDSYEITETGYKIKFVVSERAATYNATLKAKFYGLPYRVDVSVYKPEYEAPEQDLSLITLSGIFGDYDYDNYEGSSQLIIYSSRSLTSPMLSASTNPHTLTVNVVSLDKQGNRSPVSITEEGIPITFNDEKTQFTVQLPDNTEKTIVTRKIVTLQNEAGKENTCYAKLAGTWHWDFESSGTEYPSNKILHLYALRTFNYTWAFDATDTVGYGNIKAFENNVKTFDNFKIVAENNSLDWVQYTFDTETGNVGVTLTENNTGSTRLLTLNIQQVDGEEVLNKGSITIKQNTK